MLYTYDECINKFGTKYLVKKAVENGSLFQLDKGIYSDRKRVSEEVVIARKYPKAVLTLNSAFYYYNLTDVVLAANAAGVNIARVVTKETDLETYFVKLVGGESNG